MDLIGHPSCPIYRNSDRSPAWPSGLCGSLSHCRDLAAAIVSTDAMSVGIDVESLHRIGKHLYCDLFTVIELSQSCEEPAVTARFSAKEAVFKAMYPMSGRRADFNEIEVNIDIAGGRFTARYLGPHSENRLIEKVHGHVAATDRHVLTVAVLDGTALRPRLC